MKQLKFKRLDPTAILPTRGSAHAAGLDLYTTQEAVFEIDGQVGTLSTGVAVEIPEGYYGRIAPRSSLAARHGVTIWGGVIDADYRGEIKVMVQVKWPWRVNPGDRIAQLIIEKIETPEPVWDKELEETARGAGGFGSTGK